MDAMEVIQKKLSISIFKLVLFQEIYLEINHGANLTLSHPAIIIPLVNTTHVVLLSKLHHAAKPVTPSIGEVIRLTNPSLKLYTMSLAIKMQL